MISASTLVAAASITVFSTPIVFVNSGSVCAGGSFTLTPSGASTYTYQGGNAVITPSATGVYTVRGTNTVGCVSAISASANITVIPLPTISVVSGTLCSGAFFTITPSGANTYTVQGLTSIVSPTANATYTVTGTSSQGCDAGSPATCSITIVASPTLTVNSGTTCANIPYTITPSGAVSYTYQGGNATVNPSVSTTYSIIGSSSVGCVSPPAIANITVFANPIISVNSGSVCNGQVFTMNASGASTYSYFNGNSTVIPTGNATYSVTGTSSAGCISIAPAVATVTFVNGTPTLVVNSGTTCSGLPFTINASGAQSYTYLSGGSVVSPTVNTSYTVTGISALGCLGTAVANITVLANPTIAVNSGTLCSGTVFTMMPTGANTYTYSNGSSTVAPTGNSSYSVSGTGTNGCISTAMAVCSVTVITGPVVTISTTKNMFCTGDDVTFTGGGATTYSWSNNTSGGTATMTAVLGTVYSVTGTDANGCMGVASMNLIVLPCTGIKEQNAQVAGINVYPNPNNGEFFVDVNSHSQIMVFNALGEIIVSQMMESGTHKLNLNNRAKGVYFIRVVSSGRTQNVRVVKE